jgi:type IV pilus assembly protein PilX
MLTHNYPHLPAPGYPWRSAKGSGSGNFNGLIGFKHQTGVALMITLIMLAVMLLAAITLLRSADTTNLIAGNMALRQMATHSGDDGTEAALAFLETNNGTNTLWTSDPTNGYSATRQDPSPGQSWGQWWTSVAVPRGVVVMAQNSAGYTSSYTIDRLCGNAVDPMSPNSNCSKSSYQVTSGSDQTAGSQGLNTISQVYYRITTRIDGPRNTVSYIQTIVSL